MKILIRNSDSAVIYAQNDLVLDTEAHGNGWRDPNFNTENATITEAVLPKLWTGAVWSYNNGEWAVVDSARYAKLLAADQAILIREVQDKTQQRLDAFASTRNYAGILSACTYATSTVPKFATEGQYCVEARDTTWAQLYEILAEVQAGTRPVPAGYSEIESELPVLAWPGN